MNGYPLFVGFSSSSATSYTSPQSYCSLMVTHFRVLGTTELLIDYCSGCDFEGHHLPSGRLYLSFTDSSAQSLGLHVLVAALARGGHCVCFDLVTAFSFVYGSCS